jgi:DNA-binding XRE family transcriptional regulator
MERQRSEVALALAEQVRASRLPPPRERRRIREAARVSLRRAGEELGVDPMTVLRWERGVVEPRLEHAIAYRELLDALAEAMR